MTVLGPFIINLKLFVPRHLCTEACTSIILQRKRLWWGRRGGHGCVWRGVYGTWICTWWSDIYHNGSYAESNARYGCQHLSEQWTDQPTAQPCLLPRKTLEGPKDTHKITFCLNIPPCTECTRWRNKLISETFEVST